MWGALLAALLVQTPVNPPLALPGYRLHLLVHEDLDPDQLRSLAREGTVLWLSTRGSILRESTVESIAKFKEAYVQVRPPISTAAARQLARAPNAGVWIEADQAAGDGLYRLGPRRRAVTLVGPLDPVAFEKLRNARPDRIEWRPQGPTSLLAWSYFRMLPGHKVIRPEAAMEGAKCSAWPRASRPALWVDSAEFGADPQWRPPCGYPLRVRLWAPPGDSLLRWLYGVDPAVELELEIGANPTEVGLAKAVIAQLELAVAGGSTTKRQ